MRNGGCLGFLFIGNAKSVWRAYALVFQQHRMSKTTLAPAEDHSQCENGVWGNMVQSSALFAKTGGRFADYPRLWLRRRRTRGGRRVRRLGR
ncbi:hypothetical protein BT67DRAFT_300807 [Trichocladium antarcticum]|uniref:Uncharacterized protein n=1 Tax=Trichocladium antarcticum TaxID=1450529 RepID=A0AAN6ZE91_9PEZI|nr:hypothetical protein BT67DRAFT_300807 [Trichocladium antarcticum]